MTKMCRDWIGLPDDISWCDSADDDVDSVESITNTFYDYVLIATINPPVIKSITIRLKSLGVPEDKILTVECSEDTRESLLQKYLY